MPEHRKSRALRLRSAVAFVTCCAAEHYGSMTTSDHTPREYAQQLRTWTHEGAQLRRAAVLWRYAARALPWPLPFSAAAYARFEAAHLALMNHVERGRALGIPG